MRENGQIISIDLVASMLVFAALLFFLYQSWATNMDAWARLQEETGLQERAVQEARVLVESPGYPTNWSASDANVIGLAIRPNVLSPEKINCLGQLDYNSSRDKMNIRAYNFKITFSSDDHSLDRNIGINPPAGAAIASVEREVLVEGKNAVFRFQLFR